MVAVSGETHGFKIDLGLQCIGLQHPGLVALQKRIPEDFQCSDMRYYFLTSELLEESQPSGWGGMGGKSRSQVQFWKCLI